MSPYTSFQMNFKTSFCWDDKCFIIIIFCYFDVCKNFLFWQIIKKIYYLDEGFYHCAFILYLKNDFFSLTFQLDLMCFVMALQLWFISKKASELIATFCVFVFVASFWTGWYKRGSSYYDGRYSHSIDLKY